MKARIKPFRGRFTRTIYFVVHLPDGSNLINKDAPYDKSTLFTSIPQAVNALLHWLKRFRAI